MLYYSFNCKWHQGTLLQNTPFSSPCVKFHLPSQSVVSSAPHFVQEGNSKLHKLIVIRIDFMYRCKSKYPATAAGHHYSQKHMIYIYIYILKCRETRNIVEVKNRVTLDNCDNSNKQHEQLHVVSKQLSTNIAQIFEINESATFVNFTTNNKQIQRYRLHVNLGTVVIW